MGTEIADGAPGERMRQGAGQQGRCDTPAAPRAGERGPDDGRLDRERETESGRGIQHIDYWNSLRHALTGVSGLGAGERSDTHST
ncbi:hypothetical protein D3C79_1021030 [compost metagenome]